ncbi:Heat shock factor protein [Neolecta irregularis DAH-3]|uniref:Heat shock factor protein n=1 Tax=Neolecta irregularis (strain DAH-3) TaxID=1198029 RepID=A0A1U7LJ52_NEOID|nr:Heat shock factor protein [Neolecta irregularis DAH-3]|eukprot:OLL22582.1 Heat shock factor protein [Neolecta irregularis DAH-3]
MTAASHLEQPSSTALLKVVYTPQPQAKNVPTFLNKVYSMVNENATDDLIRWSDSGESFLVIRPDEVAKDVLPRYFKHKNFSSFVRQLNMYGFHKVPHLQQGVLQSETPSEMWEFSSPNFVRDQPDLLCLVTRKKGGAPAESEINLDYSALVNEIQAVKKHQAVISSDLKRLQMDNQMLWRETLESRERHQQHQGTIDKIMRFLESVFAAKKGPNFGAKKDTLLLENGEDPLHDKTADQDQLMEFTPTDSSIEEIQNWVSGFTLRLLNAFTLDNLRNSPSQPRFSSLATESSTSIVKPKNALVPTNMSAIDHLQQNGQAASLLEAHLATQGGSLQAISDMLGLDSLGLQQNSDTEHDNLFGDDFNSLVNTEYFDDKSLNHFTSLINSAPNSRASNGALYEPYEEIVVPKKRKMG